jgi:hypothetical protein
MPCATVRSSSMASSISAPSARATPAPPIDRAARRRARGEYPAPRGAAVRCRAGHARCAAVRRGWPPVSASVRRATRPRGHRSPPPGASPTLALAGEPGAHASRSGPHHSETEVGRSRGVAERSGHRTLRTARSRRLVVKNRRRPQLPTRGPRACRPAKGRSVWPEGIGRDLGRSSDAYLKTPGPRSSRRCSRRSPRSSRRSARRS